MMNVLGYRSRRVRVLCILCCASLASVLGVVLVARAGTVVTGSFGASGTGAGQFGAAGPAGLAVNKTSGNVYAVDTANNRVEEFNEDGTFIRAFGLNVGGPGNNVCTSSCFASTGTASELAVAGAMNAPQGIAVDQANGNLYVTDKTNHRVDVFSAEGAFEGAFGWGVASHAAQMEFCTTTCLAGLTGGNAGEFSTEIGYPAVDPSSSHIVVADKTNARIDEFTPTLTAGVVVGASFVRAFGNSVVSSGPDHFNEITDVTVRASAGRFTLSFGGETTGELAYNVPASGGSGATASVQNALEALPAIGVGNVKVAGGPGNEAGINPYGVTFTGAFAGAAKGPITAADGAIPLSGGSATATVTTLNAGGVAGYEVCNAGANPSDVCKNGENSTAVGGFNGTSPARVAVDSTGAVYALSVPSSGCKSVSPGLCRTQKFSAGGTVAAEFAPAQLKLESGKHAEVAPTDIAIGANNDLLVVKPNASPEEQRVLEFSSSGSGPIAEHGVGNGLSSANGLAAVESSRLYLSTSSGNKVYILTPPPAPTVTISPVTDIGATTATFNGAVTPPPAGPSGGFDTTYHFEYSTNGVNWTSFPASDVDVGSVNSSVAVHQSVPGLSPNTLYEVRLFATTGTPATPSTTGFTTTVEPPTVSSTVASPVTATTAKLTGYVNPNNSPTSYHYEWGATASYGNQAPVDFTPFIGSGGQPLPVPVSISGFTPATTYHFRLVASSPAGTTDGPDEEFATLSPEGTCPNEELRTESNPDPATGGRYSLALPDCRAYEQLTPPFKNGARITLTPGISAAGIQAISSAGSPIVASSPSLWGTPGGDPAGLTDGAYYTLTRGASAWNVASLTPPVSQLAYSTPMLSSSLDATAGVWVAATPSQSITAADLYLRDSGGTFTDIGPVAPPPASAGSPLRGSNATYFPGMKMPDVGASADMTRVLFAINTPDVVGHQSYLWPGDGTSLAAENENQASLYEYVGSGHPGEGVDVPRLVGLDNTGAQITQCGTNLGAADASGRGNARGWVSAGGSSVFFAARAAGCATGATGPSSPQLYARIGAPGTQATVNVAGTYACATSASCNVTGAVTYQGAAKDGSKAFFTSTQALLPSDKDTTNDMYECELPGDGGATPTPSGKVNACPTLKAVSVSGTSSGANVQSVVAVSEEGARIYYIATGVVTSTPNSQGQVAQGGQDNLYVYEPDAAHPGQYTTAFIATLPTASLAQAQVTPDGRYLVFTTTADLTPDDTSTAAQVFRFDAQSGELIRVSVGQGGFNNDGNTNGAPARLAPLSEGAAEKRGITISEDGSYVVFQSNDALTPQVQGGLRNVYEWHDGNVSLISDGTDTNENAGLIGMDPSGKDVFFTTADKLVGQDSDESVDVYDARIEGGFPAPLVPAGCKGEECEGPLTAPLGPVSIGSGGPAAIGNLTPGPTTFPPEEKQVAHVAVSSLKAKLSGNSIALAITTSAKGSLTVTGKYVKATTVKGVAAGKKALSVRLTTAGVRLKRRHRKTSVRVTLRVGRKSASRTVFLKL